VNGYKKERDGSVVGSGAAQAIGEKRLALSSKFAPTKDPNVVVYTDRQGTTKLKGTVRREGDNLVLTYGAEGGKEDAVKEVLMFSNADRTVDGEVYSGGKLVLAYRMKRIASDLPVPVLEGKDPVLLTQGKSELGKTTVWADFEGFRYSFVSTESKREFLRDPGTYSVQFGGACMNMGPLSGRGQPQLFEVHANRLYLFASEACRAAFLTAPDAFVDRADEAFKVTPVALTEAIALLDKAALAHGEVDKVNSVTRIRNTTYDQGGKAHRFDLATFSNFKDTFADCQAYDGNTYVALMSPKSSWMGVLSAPGLLVQSEQDVFRRQNLRDPLAILKNRRTPGFVAEALGNRDAATLKGQVAIRTHFKGATTVVYLDPSSHAVTGIQHIGRPATADVIKVFGDMREVGGVRVPFLVTTHASSGRTSELKYDSIRVNEPLDQLPVVNPLGG